MGPYECSDPKILRKLNKQRYVITKGDVYHGGLFEEEIVWKPLKSDPVLVGKFGSRNIEKDIIGISKYKISKKRLKLLVEKLEEQLKYLHIVESGKSQNKEEYKCVNAMDYIYKEFKYKDLVKNLWVDNEYVPFFNLSYITSLKDLKEWYKVISLELKFNEMFKPKLKGRELSKRSGLLLKLREKYTIKQIAEKIQKGEYPELKFKIENPDIDIPGLLNTYFYRERKREKQNRIKGNL